MAAPMLQQSMSVFAIAATAKLGPNISGEFRVQQQLNFNRSKALVSWGGYGRLQRFAESTPQKQQLRIVLIADEGQQQATRRQTQQKKLRAESSIAEDFGSRSIDSGIAYFVRLSLSLSLSLSHAHSFQIRSLQGLHNCFE